MGNSLDKIHVTVTYNDLDASDFVDIIRLDTIIVEASYSYLLADDFIDLVQLDNLYASAVYRDVNAGYVNFLLWDKFHVTAVYRDVPPILPPQPRRMQNINFGTWPFILWGTPVLEAVKDELYTGFLVTHRSGIEPITYYLNGDWPTGLVIEENGLVTGTPIEEGVFPDLSVLGIDAELNEATLPVGTLTVVAS